MQGGGGGGGGECSLLPSSIAPASILFFLVEVFALFLAPVKEGKGCRGQCSKFNFRIFGTRHSEK